ncbi:MAG: sulfatase [Anaerolineae bacterium]|jgi:arylsulfatase A-like enzyme|nr:sulfatase [Chloroflexota bacterium]
MVRPNIVFILIDDMGWRDLGCYGSSFYETPHIDALAARGVRFTNAYAACPVCSPTRASILTGKYPARLGVTDWIDWGGSTHPARGRLVDVPYVKQLSEGEHTLADALQAGGYATWHVGKWHLGGPGHVPTDHGFEVNVGGCEWGSPGREGYFSPWGIPALRDADVPEGTYLTDYLTDRAIGLIQGRDERPFFLNLWYYTVHTPIQAKEERVAYYRDKAHRLRLDQRDPFVDGGPFPTEHKRQLHIQRRILQSDPVYAAMIDHLDENVGRLMATLEAEGLLENTIVVFLSDNGGLATAEGSPTCNAPLAEGKGWMYEGGTREPQFVAGPGLPAGALCDAVTTSTDWYPTLLELAGLPLLPAQHVDGVSLAPLLREPNTTLEREAIYWHYPHYGNQGGTPGCSLRQGDYKLIEFFEDGRLELYNLREDVSEARNLAAEQPERTAALHRLLVRWRQEIEARIPQPNPDWRE